MEWGHSQKWIVSTSDPNTNTTMAGSRCLVLSLLFFTFNLQGCDASDMKMLSVFIGVSGAMATCGTLIMGCLACSQPPGKAKRTCLMFGIPGLLAMAAIWVGFGLLVAHMNCKTLRSYEPESCEWLEPPPGGFTLEDCCVSVPTTASPERWPEIAEIGRKTHVSPEVISPENSGEVCHFASAVGKIYPPCLCL